MSKKKLLILGCTLSSFLFSSIIFAATQTIVPSQTSFEVSAGDTVKFTINYPSSNPDSTGLGLKIYYDSSKLSPVNSSPVNGLSDFYTDKIKGAQDLADENNTDSDSATDRVFVIGWAATSQFDPIWNPSGEDLVTVTFTATDSFSSSTTINFTGKPAARNTFSASSITVEYKDTVNPSITAPAAVTVNATGATTAVPQAALGNPTTSDNSGASPSVSYSPQGPFTTGDHTITWKATDGAGNTATATQTLTIVDNTAPQITAPADITKVATGVMTAVQLGVPTVTDNTDNNPVITKNHSENVFGLGTHTITWTATDASGNASTDTQTVTITDPGAPILSAPDAIIKEATGPTTAVDLGEVKGSDVIDGDKTATASNTGPFPVGETVITWMLTNSRGVAKTVTQKIIIKDTTAPTITAPQGKTVSATGVNTTVDIGTATATDLVDGTVTVTSNAPATFTIGTHTIIWTAKDAKGNKATVEQKIIVADKNGPTITAPADQTLEATAVLTPVNLGSATAADVVDGVLEAAADKSGPFAVGVHTVTWSVEDSSGNKVTATQTITIKDTTKPTITAPADINKAATGQQTPVTLGTPTVSDLADANPTVNANKTGPFNVGVHTITWTVEDVSGNKATDTQIVTVSDTSGPKITTPADITKEATGATTAVTLGSATAVDLTDGTVAVTADKTGPFTVGVHTITYTAKDSDDNIVTETQKVTITDTIAPTITAPASKTVQATGVNTTVDIGVASATDLVDGEVTVTSDAPDTFTIGTHTITWTATDAKGNKATVTQTIKVSDDNGPSITAPANITKEATGETTPVDIGQATASDAIDGDLTPTADNEGPFAVGTHTITWTVKDSANNEASTTQTVTITDTTVPSLTVVEVLTLTATGVNTPISDYQVSATDIVDGSITPVGYVLVNGDEQALPTGGFVSGAHHLIWKVTDNANNTTTVEQTIKITPLVNFIATQAASAGDAVTVSVALSGNAVSYPVTIPYSIDTQTSTVVNDGTDHDAVNGEITISSGITGSFSFNVADNPALNGTGSGELVFVMGTTTHAVAGPANTHKVLISSENIDPIVSLSMTQSGSPVSLVVDNAGNVVITATASDSASQTLTYDWSQSDATLSNVSANEELFEFNPTGLTAGTYTVKLTVKDNGSPIAQTTVAITFTIEAGSVTVVDTDGDGISDDKDHVAEANRLPAEEEGKTSYILESEAGTKLQLGDTARKQGKNSATIDLTGLPEIPAEYEQTTTDIYDFKIIGVAQGESTLIVLPQHNPIPAQASYLKTDGSTWRAFAEDGKNVLYSAQRISDGVCPLTGDNVYLPGLKQGDYCVQLKIEDGGANDTDNLVNGSVADPGVVVAPKDAASGTNDTVTISSKGGGSMPWFLLPLLLLTRRFKRKQ